MSFDDTFEPENFMPTQWKDLFLSRVSSPEQKLMYQVLDQAIRDYILNHKTRASGNVYWGNSRGQGKAEARWRQEIRMWIRGETVGVVSFAMVCEAFDRDIDESRKKVLATLDRLDVSEKQEGRAMLTIPRRGPVVIQGALAGKGEASNIRHQWSAGGRGGPAARFDRGTGIKRSHKRKEVEVPPSEENVE